MYHNNKIYEEQVLMDDGKSKQEPTYNGKIK